jgi:hypothetical protein
VDWGWWIGCQLSLEEEEEEEDLSVVRCLLSVEEEEMRLMIDDF